MSMKGQQDVQGKARPNYILYEQLLTGCFDKIRKTVPRKCKELRDCCDKAIEQVKADSSDEILSANKYFKIMKLAFDTKIPRLTEQILYHIQKLVAHGLLDGNHPDDCIYPEDEKPRSNGTLPRKLIDAIVDEVCKCTAEIDQQVQLQVVRALLTIVATSSTEVHERSLLKVMSSLYYIHIASTNPINQNTAKASLVQIISIVFKKMEQYSGDFGETLKRLNMGESSQGSIESFRQQAPQQQATKQSARQTAGGPQVKKIDLSDQVQNKSSGRQEESKEEITSTAVESTLVTFTPEEQYAQVTLTYLVDNVCLHAARKEQVKNQYEDQIQQIQVTGQSDDQVVQTLYDQMVQDTKEVPLFSVPASSKSRKKDEPAKSNILKKVLDNGATTNLLNEQGIPSGKFGWCISCRASANLYCKHTRHPVCSFECKQRHIKLLEDAQITHEEQIVPPSSARSANKSDTLDEPHARDALLVFNKLCQLLSSKDLDGKLENVSDVRKVLLGLDLIHSCLENPGHCFVQRQEFVKVIREQLCGALLKFAVSSEHKIFSRTVSIFYCLFLHFREHLKQTIGVFIQNFFLRILDSGNSEYDYKYSILEFFDRLSENTCHILDIFANFDCDITQKDICVKIIDSLSSIAQGRFQKSEHQSVVTAQQEASLRRQALEILIKVLRNLNRTIDAEVKLEGLAQTQLAQNRQERMHAQKVESSQETRNDDDDSGSRGNQSLFTEQEDDNLQRQNSKQGPTVEESSHHAAESMDAKKQIQNRQYKSDMTKAAEKFNLKPKNGLKYLVDKGYIKAESGEERLKGICNFLKNTPALSVTEIGIYVGGHLEEQKAVLSTYIDEYDFKNRDMSFIECLKMPLQSFRLPGESQCIDRIMEKFGEKLSKDRPEDFGNAEGVYLLAYATLMLQTSVHNPEAKKLKMSLDDFKKITKGVKLNDREDMDYDALKASIYDNILREPFTLDEDEDARMKLEASTNTNKKLLFDKEREGILKRGHNMLRQDTSSTKFIMIKDISSIKPMFEHTWSANLAVFSVVLDETDDQITSDLCLQGFMHAIRISGHFEINDVRNAFVSSLNKFTQVDTYKELKQKNINCIRELLNLAIHDGDCLKDSWSYVIDCISKIDHMRTVGLGDLTDSEYFQNEQVQSQNQTLNQQLLIRNSAIIAEQIDSNQIETIFLQSENLNQDAIIDFIENLCKVSKQELSDPDNPKKFCLQKLVEVASLNMNRVRFQWQSIWSTLGQHFIEVGNHNNLNVAIYAIDSLRQLSDKFLEKEELRNFSYQKIFLKPFETIMMDNLMNQSKKEIKEYIVMCIASLCHQKCKFIRSGWEVILNIFTMAAQDNEQHLVMQSFQSLDNVVQNHFHLLEESFVELVNCLSKFSLNQSQSSKALHLLGVCAKNLYERPSIIDGYVLSHGHSLHQRDQERMQRQPPCYGIRSEYMNKQIPGSQKQAALDSKVVVEADDLYLSVQKELWFPILNNLTGMIVDKNQQIRRDALLALQQILECHYQAFGERFWKEILSQVIYPVIEDIRLKVEQSAKKGDQAQIQLHIQIFQHLTLCLNNFIFQNQQKLPSSLIANYSDILCLYASNINNHDLATVLMEQMRELLAQAGQKLESAEQWQEIIDQISLLYQITVPKLLQDELKANQNSNVGDMIDQGRIKQSTQDMKPKFKQSYTKSTIQLMLTQSVYQIVQRYFEYLTVDQVQILLKNLDSQLKFAKEFNSEVNLRYRLWKQGYMDELKHLPGLLALEEESLKTYLNILFKQHFSTKNSNSKALFELSAKVLKDYVLTHNKLIQINNSKQSAKNQPGQISTIDQQQSKLHEIELEKQLQHQSPIVHEVILENILALSEQDMQDLNQQVGQFPQLLVDLTLCDDRQVRIKNHKLLTRILESKNF